MSDKDLSLAARLLLDVKGWVDGLKNGERKHDEFREHIAENMERINRSIEKVKGTLEAFGVGLGGYELLKENALLEKSLGQIQLKAGAGKQEIGELNEMLEADARRTGTAMGDLLGAVSGVVSHGDDLKSIVEMIHSANDITKVWGGSVQETTLALRDMAQGFNIDLTKSGAAEELADKMSVAAKHGNLDPVQEAQIIRGMGKKGGAPGGMNIDETLGWIQALSKIDSSPAAVGGMSRTLASLFNNTAAKGELMRTTGIRFAEHGKDRDPIAVLREFEERYLAKRTAVDKEVYLARTIGKVDASLIPTLKQLFERGSLDEVFETAKATREAHGEAGDNVTEAMHNAADQAQRMKEYFDQMADNVTGPINSGLVHLMDFNTKLAEKTEHPATVSTLLTGAEILGVAGAGWGLKKLGGKMGGLLGKMLGGSAGLAEGVAEGKVVEKLAGVTPVFVTNWPGGGASGPLEGNKGGVATAVEEAAAGGAAVKAASKVPGWFARMVAGFGGDATAVGLAGATVVGGVTAAGAAGYGAGSLIYKAIDTTEFADKLGGVIAQALANLGDKDAQDALDRRQDQDIKGSLKISIDSTGKPSVTGMQSRGLDLDVSTGPFGFAMGG